MPGFKELKDKLKTDEELRNKFFRVKGTKEAIDIAKSLGFEISEDDIENDRELSDDLLEAVAGGEAGKPGKGDTVINEYKFYDVESGNKEPVGGIEIENGKVKSHWGKIPDKYKYLLGQ